MGFPERGEIHEPKVRTCHPQTEIFETGSFGTDWLDAQGKPSDPPRQAISISDGRIRIMSLKSVSSADTLIYMLNPSPLTVSLAVLALVARVRVTVVGSEWAADNRS